MDNQTKLQEEITILCQPFSVSELKFIEIYNVNKENIVVDTKLRIFENERFPFRIVDISHYKNIHKLKGFITTLCYEWFKEEELLENNLPLKDGNNFTIYYRGSYYFSKPNTNLEKLSSIYSLKNLITQKSKNKRQAKHYIKLASSLYIDVNKFLDSDKNNAYE